MGGSEEFLPLYIAFPARLERATNWFEVSETFVPYLYIGVLCPLCSIYGGKNVHFVDYFHTVFCGSCSVAVKGNGHEKQKEKY
mgnify:CR=1 FL=1